MRNKKKNKSKNKNKDKKSLSTVIVVIIIIVLIAVIFNMFYDKSQKENLMHENKINSEVTNEKNNVEIENVVESEVEKGNESTSNTVNENKIKEDTMSTVYEQNNDIGSTDKKQEAINMVKEKWGKDDSVTFRCDSITKKGEYIIAVISKNSAIVQNYFKVNLETKTVVVDY